MASAAVSLATAGGAFTAIPVVGWAVAIAAGVIDAYAIAPRLQGQRRGAARSPRLVDVPVGSNEAGAPRIWAIGRRVRVPTHILWQGSKVREETVGSRKQGTEANLRRVYFDALVALNDRPTSRLTQLIGNGKLLLFRTRNVISVESATMTVSVSGGRVILTAGSTLDPDFTDKFVVGKAVQLSGFVMSAGTDLNAGYWKVAAVTTHTSTPSTIELSPYSGQTVAGIAATSGNAFAPATVTRVDDVGFVEVNTITPTGFFRYIAIVSPTISDISDAFVPGDRVRLVGFTFLGTGAPFPDTEVLIVDGFLSPQPDRLVLRRQGGVATYPTLTTGGATNPGRIVFADPKPFANGFFPTTFEPDLYYHIGTETQIADPLLDASKGTASSPGYRGVACQGLDDFYVSQFGDQLPFALEALIDPDQSMDWGTALATILRDRAGIPNSAIDVTGIDPVPFLGFALRGPVEAATALQPLLVAGQIVGQERDGKIALFDIENADIVQIENGAAFSHMAARLDGESPLDDKVQIEDEAEEDLPTSIGVRHQDPDNQYADGYQQFGLRNPRGVRHENRQEIDLSNLVLSRKDARNLAATTLRRAWINRRTFRMTLTAHYIHLLENDLVTWTDDDANEFTARIIQRDIGSDFRVSITAVEEDVDLAVAGSPVQSAAGDPPPQMRSAAPVLRVVVIDAPAVDDNDAMVPQIGLAVCAEPGSAWTGAQVWESTDKGFTWGIVGTISQQASIGTVTNSNASEPASETVSNAIPESAEVLTSDFASVGQVAISDAASEDAQAGSNWALLIDADGGQELVAYRTAAFVSDSTWDLTGLYRGLRGTTARARDAGSTLVRLSPVGDAGIFWRRFPGEVAAKPLLYKVVPFGGSFDDAETIGLTAKWRNVLPLPVREVARTIVAGNDARVRVVSHWSRRVQPVGTQPPHTLDEPVEAYQFDFYAADGSKITRTKTLTAEGTGSPTMRDKWVTYTAAEQTQDGYTPGASVEIKVMVRQIGLFGIGPGEMVTVGP
jgi:hypothetical protein